MTFWLWPDHIHNTHFYLFLLCGLWNEPVGATDGRTDGQTDRQTDRQMSARGTLCTAHSPEASRVGGANEGVENTEL